MKLVFNDVEIPDTGSVIFNNINMDYVFYNGVLVWKKSILDKVPLNVSATKTLVEKIVISWDEPQDSNGNPVQPDSYKLYRNGSLLKSGITKLTYTDAGLPYGAQYEYYVTAIFGSQESNESNTVIGKTKVNSGSVTYTSNAEFTVPAGVTRVSVCMVGGGGSGAAYSLDVSGNVGPRASGGKAGEEYSKIVTVIPGDKISVTVGKGGKAVESKFIPFQIGPGQGISGGRTTFGPHIAKGGKGGCAVDGRTGDPDCGYFGNGAKGKDGCGGGGYKDGTSFQDTPGDRAWGGEASSFGHGGDAGGRTGSINGGVGAGGGGNAAENATSIFSGAGGDGICIIAWGNEITSTVSSQVATNSASSTTSSVINTINKIKTILGYDPLDSNYFNTIRYSLNGKNEKPEFISSDFNLRDFYDEINSIPVENIPDTLNDLEILKKENNV